MGQEKSSRVAFSTPLPGKRVWITHPVPFNLWMNTRLFLISCGCCLKLNSALEDPRISLSSWRIIPVSRLSEAPSSLSSPPGDLSPCQGHSESRALRKLTRRKERWSEKGEHGAVYSTSSHRMEPTLPSLTAGWTVFESVWFRGSWLPLCLHLG